MRDEERFSMSGGSSFRDLRIWKKGYELLLRIYQTTARYPSDEKYGLSSDTRRSANSIIANIAESHGRYHYADKVRVLLIARGEIEEIRSHLSVAMGNGYISNEIFEELDNEYSGLGMGLNAFIDDLERKSKKP